MTFLQPKILNNQKRKEPKRRDERKDPNHLAWLHTLPCCVSGSMENVIAHHLLIKEERGVGMKAPDSLTVPLDAVKHVELHNQVPKHMQEWEWFAKQGVRFHRQLAERLYRNSGDNEMAEMIIRSHRP